MFVPSHSQAVFGGDFPAAATSGCAKTCMVHLQGLQLPSLISFAGDYRQTSVTSVDSIRCSYTSCSWRLNTRNNTCTWKFCWAGYGHSTQLFQYRVFLPSSVLWPHTELKFQRKKRNRKHVLVRLVTQMTTPEVNTSFDREHCGEGFWLICEAN